MRGLYLLCTLLPLLPPIQNSLILQPLPSQLMPTRLRGGSVHGRGKVQDIVDGDFDDGMCPCGDPSCTSRLKHPQTAEDLRRKRYNDIATEHLQKLAKGEPATMEELPMDMQECLVHEIRHGELKEMFKPVTPWWKVAPFGNISRAEGDKRDVACSKGVEETSESIAFNGRECGSYSWAQDREKVCFFMFVDKQVQSKQIDVRVALQSLLVSIDKVPIQSIRLSYPVRCSEEATEDCWGLTTMMGRKLLKVTLYKSMLGLPVDAPERAEGLWWRSFSTLEEKMPEDRVVDKKSSMEEVVLRHQKPFHAPPPVGVEIDPEALNFQWCEHFDLQFLDVLVAYCSVYRQVNGRMTEDPVGVSSMLQSSSHSLRLLRDRSFTCYAQVLSSAALELHPLVSGTAQEKNLLMLQILQDVEAILSSYEAPFYALSGCLQVMEKAEAILWEKAEEGDRKLITSKEVEEVTLSSTSPPPSSSDDDDEEHEDRMVAVHDPDKSKRMLISKNSRRESLELASRADDLSLACEKVQDILSCLWVANMSYRDEMLTEVRRAQQAHIFCSTIENLTLVDQMTVTSDVYKHFAIRDYIIEDQRRLVKLAEEKMKV
ncbi:hypothetical protein GUITHDRAFT_144355 [Guillardia theta CCMP2712]|uniref:CS domain-containing protein n=2 Tax=Guillardia theta TaxID=55529 RepID=L1IQZ2_GUITC|nr:hypothetical protein GUITHDRAFT_144355 [Guillardia theta CCMP2712]EKX38240.1 hypothetical protein GUITHDRAFT_144355 [Guillardia theta CCMP2712]|eukprot:XP_005825220.1 hypothetical protein GUITHDRAFT_144355 [Guillardia theta CCMP2712]